ncbi:MAG TPA: trypsin-like peptidase domain-containing protein [Pseudolabrys sp.]|nr:trypsin-like peptidase domain-containing protein [Pseudolabrys sp.]
MGDVTSVSIRCGLLLFSGMLILGCGPAAAQYYSGPGDAGVFMKSEPATSSKPTGKKPAAKPRHHRHALVHATPLPRVGPRAPSAKARKPAAAGKAQATQPIAAETTLEGPVAKKRGDVKLPTPRPDLSPPNNGPASMPDDERQRIQSALLWAGDYDGIGQDDPPLTAAVRNYQKRHNAPVTGVLTVKQRAELLAAGDRHHRRFGWRVVIDPATGIRIGLPTRLAPKARVAPHGTRWSSPNGEVQIETFRLEQPDLSLKDLYARERKTPPTRQVLRGTLRDNDFRLNGMQGLRYFDVHAVKRDGEIRGYTLLYDQSMLGIVEPVANAMAAAFAPFPARAMPFAVLDMPVEYGTGLIVGARGAILTNRQLTDGCKIIVVSGFGDADRVAEGKENGLALLRVYGRRKLPVLPLPPTRAAANAKAEPSKLRLLGIPGPDQQHGGGDIQTITGRLAGSDGIALDHPAPLAGLSGAAVLGPEGQVLGMMQMRKLAPVRLAKAATIRAFLRRHQISPAEAGDARRAVVRVICVRN